MAHFRTHLRTESLRCLSLNGDLGVCHSTKDKGMLDQADHTTAVDEPGDQSSDILVEGMLLVEELSIDGTCGVY